MAFITLETEDANGLMNLLVSQMIDNADLSADGKAKLRTWRSDHASGTVEMSDLTIAFNDALGQEMDERQRKLIKRKGRYVSTSGQRG
ncbi:MAG TPA: hypothetical protein VFO84_02415 [Dehalococcoidia bacterium]|nr:hypothetical protein [Dehalococcoidia bacterium]